MNADAMSIVLGQSLGSLQESANPHVLRTRTRLINCPYLQVRSPHGVLHYDIVNVVTQLSGCVVDRVWREDIPQDGATFLRCTIATCHQDMPFDTLK